MGSEKELAEKKALEFSSKSFLGKVRWFVNMHFYGQIFVYVSIWTLIKHFLVLFNCVFGVNESREQLLTKCKESFKKKFGIPEDQKVVIGETARSLFYAFLLSLEVKKNEYVILTPMQHYSFIRICNSLNIQTITVDMKTDGTGWDWETFFKHMTPEMASRCRACIVTHQFGNNQPFEEMIDFCEEHGILIFEDCIQGNAVYQNFGNPRATMSVFSGGCDKIPCTTKGGFGVVHNDLHVADDVEAVIENFGEKTWNNRYKDLMSQTAYFFLVATKLGGCLICMFGVFWKQFDGLHHTIHWVRKNFLKAYTGKFTVDRVSYRPSLYHLKAIELGIERSERSEIEMLAHSREDFRKILGEKYVNIIMPWAKNNNTEDCNLYFHFLPRNRDLMLQTMSNEGWSACYQQAWGCVPQHPAFPLPTYAQHLTDHGSYFPLTHQMMDYEMEEMAQIVRTYVDTYHSDGNPYFPAEVVMEA